ncbi:hypothetical protein LZ318_03335 [Saccharopolyspora indica]|uniref:hypothetical protein n=1 Tax=Saccharopolyspora indica TaxID=1229659 RepID=UPI0022EAD675|nr:hypothetical protein [Saccharopolyspora indica]MDA3649938.1 hypothetical protein [Saccharopolyspora indica]
MFAVDAKGFSDAPSAHQEQLGKEIPQLLEQALGQCGLSRLWETRLFGASTGDGYYFGVDAVDTPFLVDPLLRELQEVLEAHDEVVRARSRDLRMRLRASIHVGPIPDSGLATPMNETHRLLDSQPVRDVLSKSDPDTTFLAVILSQRVFTDAVDAGYTKLRRTQFLRNAVSVKNFHDVGWLYIPCPSVPLGELDPIDGVSWVDVSGLETKSTVPAPSVTSRIEFGTVKQSAIAEKHDGDNNFNFGS